jgi:acyl-CoA thioesterase
MDALSFYGLERGTDDLHWRLPVVSQLCSGLGALFGGCGLGAAIEVMQRATGRPIVWSTAQFLSFARPPSIIDLEVTEIVRGHRSSQVRAVAHVGDEEIFAVVAALGSRKSPWSGSWAVRPDVPGPESCPPRPTLAGFENTVNERLEIRLANARGFEELRGPPSGDGRSSLWVRVLDLELSASTLAIIGDYVPFGIFQAFGTGIEVNSLDNTLRVAHQSPSELSGRAGWVLADIRVHAVADGFGHGLVHLWSEDGQLLGTASQSTIVRESAPEPVLQKLTQEITEGGH